IISSLQEHPHVSNLQAACRSAYADPVPVPHQYESTWPCLCSSISSLRYRTCHRAMDAHRIGIVRIRVVPYGCERASKDGASMRNLATLAFFILLVQAATAAPRVQIQVPRMTSGDLLVQAIVEPADDNRSIVISVDSGDFYRSSEMSLEGADAPHVAVFE